MNPRLSEVLEQLDAMADALRLHLGQLDRAGADGLTVGEAGRLDAAHTELYRALDRWTNKRPRNTRTAE